DDVELAGAVVPVAGVDAPLPPLADVALALALAPPLLAAGWAGVLVGVDVDEPAPSEPVVVEVLGSVPGTALVAAGSVVIPSAAAAAADAAPSSIALAFG